MEGVDVFGPSVVLVIPVVVRAVCGELTTTSPSVPGTILTRGMFNKGLHVVFANNTRLSPCCVSHFTRCNIRMLRNCKVSRYSPIVDGGALRGGGGNSVKGPLRGTRVEFRGNRVLMGKDDIVGKCCRVPSRATRALGSN